MVAVTLSGCLNSLNSAAAFPPLLESAATIGPVAGFGVVCAGVLPTGRPDGRRVGIGWVTPEFVAAGADQFGVAEYEPRRPHRSAATTHREI